MTLFPEASLPGQRFFVPEVVQTSAMDCGPAALKAILEGFGIPVSYGRLREACQTDVDGTSINTVEDIAVLLGLQAEQVMLPVDHLFLPEAQALPAIVVVQRPGGLTHFLVVWNRLGGLLQVMDPATGRRWPSWKSFRDEIYIHTFPVPHDAWREWAGSEGLLAPLRRRLSDLDIPRADIEALIGEGLDDPTWRALATLDAATRMTSALVAANGIAPGDQAGAVLARFFRLNRGGGLPRVDALGSAGEEREIPQNLRIPLLYWSALPVIEREAQADGSEPPEEVYLRGAVLVRILGLKKAAERWVEPAPGEPAEAREPAVPGEQAQAAIGEQAEDEAPLPSGEPRIALPQDLQAALQEQSYRPEGEIWKALRQDGLLTPAALAVALLLSTIGVTFEALLFQGMIRLSQLFSSTSQRMMAALVMVAFVCALLLIELPVSATASRMGRRLEARLRIAFLEKIPRLGDRYFRSRLASDMTQRAHDLRSLRMLPGLGIDLLRTAFQMVLTAIGVIWLDPRSAPLALLGSAFFVGLTLLSRPLLEERDLRLRTHVGALSRFYLDALLGLVPLKTHGAERAMMRMHETQLYEWVRTGREYYNLSTLISSLGTLLYSVFAIVIMLNYIARGGNPGEILLLFYWTLNLPALGQALAVQVQQYPMQRNRVLRLLEPLAAPDEEESWQTATLVQQAAAGTTPEADPQNWQQATPPATEVSRPNGEGGVGIAVAGVRLQAGGHVILDQVDLQIAPGEHLAIVGPSGAGKSSLVGLLLGWHRPSEGQILVDGQVLDGALVQSLRRQIAWVDPAVQLWNRSLYENLRYGIEGAEGAPLGDVITRADLYNVLERLPDGLKTTLGEGGGLVSGGEGQRVRLGRAMLRPNVRLAILDEPFRGLDRERRRALLKEARELWQQVTLLCVTHDVGETLHFPRVIVIEQGRIIEDGSPQVLQADPASRYRQLLDAEDAVRRNLWAGVNWRRLYIEAGKLSELPDPDQPK